MRITDKIILEFKDGIGWFWLLFICALFFKSYSDFVVNSDLYDYGLIYDLAWFARYAVAEFCYTALAGGLVCVAYWFSSEAAKRTKLTVFTVMFTTVGIWVGGALDFVWFFFEWIWKGKTIGLWDVWWWFPQYWLLGIEWTTVHQLIYTIIFWVIVAWLWLKTIKKEG